MPKLYKEEWKVYGDVFDKFTINTLQRLQLNHYYDELLSPVKVGKESNVFLASRKDELIIVKIYRLESCDFNKMFEYIKYDERYATLKRNRRRIIFAWVQREFRNLMKAREAGVLCPTPIKFVNNILLESMIGKDSPAPTLKTEHPINKEKFFNQVIENMKKMQKTGLVHGDLSEYNILNHNDEPYFIDFSQATESKSSRYNELWQRDIHNICRFFTKIGVKADEKSITRKIFEG